MQRILAGHRVDHEQPLVRSDRSVDRARLVHQALVDMQPACGIDDQDIVDTLPSRLERGGGDRHRVAARLSRMEPRPHLLGEPLQLQDGRRSAHIGADQQHALATGLDQPTREFGSGGGLAGALEPRQQHHIRGLRP